MYHAPLVVIVSLEKLQQVRFDAIVEARRELRYRTDVVFCTTRSHTEEGIRFTAAGAQDPEKSALLLTKTKVETFKDFQLLEQSLGDFLATYVVQKNDPIESTTRSTPALTRTGLPILTQLYNSAAGYTGLDRFEAEVNLYRSQDPNKKLSMVYAFADGRPYFRELRIFDNLKTPVLMLNADRVHRREFLLKSATSQIDRVVEDFAHGRILWDPPIPFHCSSDNGFSSDVVGVTESFDGLIPKVRKLDEGQSFFKSTTRVVTLLPHKRVPLRRGKRMPILLRARSARPQGCGAAGGDVELPPPRLVRLRGRRLCRLGDLQASSRRLAVASGH